MTDTLMLTESSQEYGLAKQRAKFRHQIGLQPLCSKR